MSVPNIFKITDERFSIERIEDFDLLIEVHKTRLKFILRDKITLTVIWLEDHFMGNIETIDEIQHNLNQVFRDHEFLKANFWNKLAVAIDFPCYCTVPKELYEPKLRDTYLKLLYPDLELSDFKKSTLEIQNYVYIFLIPQNIISVFQKVYSQEKIDFTNSTSNILKYFNNHERIQNKNILLLNDETLEAIFIEANTGFLITEKINLNSSSLMIFLDEIETKGQLKTLIFGEITPFSSYYKVIKNKLKALEFGSIPKNVKLSQYFSEIPEQRYFSLLCIDF